MKKFIVLASVVGAIFAAKADYLLWQVNDDLGAASPNNAARLMMTTATTPSGGQMVAETSLVNGLGTEEKINLATLSGFSEASSKFYIELGTYSDTFTASKVAGVYSYSDLVSAGLISSGGLTTPSGNIFGQSGVTIDDSPMSYSAVPEPGTATLILLGMAIAGLKRRRV